MDPVRESAEELSARAGYAAWAACYEEDGNPLIPLEGPAVARRKLQARPVEWVLHALPGPLPFPAAAFALVVGGLVVEHVADLPALLKEVARVLRPGGRLVLSTLHPDRTAAGQRARFIDPQTGLRRPITTYHRSVADYLNAAGEAGLVLVSEQTLVGNAELAALLPRASRYIDLPLGWVAGWGKAISSP